MNRMTLVVLCAGFMILTGCKQTEGIRFVDQSIEKLIERAQRENKPILIYWTTGESCAPCVYMEKNILHLPEVGQYFNENFICGSTGAGMYSPLKNSIKNNLIPKGFPTTFILDSSGQLIGHIYGSVKTGEEYIREAEELLNRPQ